MRRGGGEQERKRREREQKRKGYQPEAKFVRPQKQIQMESATYTF